MSSEPKNAIFRVEGLTVNPEQGTVAGTGETVRLEPKVMAVLGYLVRHRDRIVSKEELFEELWPDSIVEEVALPRSISEIRRALGDNAKEPRLIRTFPKRGYQWIGPIEATNATSSKRPLWTAAAALIAMGLTAAWWVRDEPPPLPPSVAVLPFENLSDDPDDRYFADGITDDIITQLSKIDELRVISRTSVMPYRDIKMNVRDVARELGVATVLEGSVRRDGNRVRIVGQLVDARTDSHLWAQTYDRELEDIFEVQRDVAERIARALSAELTPEDRERLGYQPTVEPSVYETYLRARSFYAQLDPASNANAIELLEQAVASEPDFALGYAALADAYARRRSSTGDNRWGERGVDTAERALTLDADLPEAHKALGHAYAGLGRSRDAIVAYEMALELRPNYADALNNLAAVYSATGQWDRSFTTYVKMLPLDPSQTVKRANFGNLLGLLGLEEPAVAWLDYALEQEPFYYGAHDMLAQLDIFAGRLGEAAKRMERQIEAQENCRHCLVRLGLLAQLQGDREDARDFFERSLELSGDATLPRLRMGQLAWDDGQRDEAERWLDEAASVPEAVIAQKSEWWGPRWALSAIASVRGDTEEALRWYEEAIGAGRRHARWDIMDPLFENIREDARFVALIDDLDERVQSMRPRAEDVPLPPR